MSGRNYVPLFVSVMVLCMVMTTLHASQIDDISCSEAISSLLPCLPFLEGSLPATPSSDCCTGATNLFNKANTIPARKSVCQCLQNASPKLWIHSERAKQLPKLCHINLFFPIDKCNS
ncbi:putative plant lipid transfer protein/Par allergen [Medicago truncatula]|uniref:Non-specific lipid-transfer protein n=1 Tax=Medicago truncatula TaxID=3880 RepID=A0A072UVW5_MEDTR|nr:Lipid transfer protein [Medicago truncatula]RHN66829.1 putative plant lipid transfer protein/Par allergen [Medicago truncatula]